MRVYKNNMYKARNIIKPVTGSDTMTLSIGNALRRYS